MFPLRRKLLIVALAFGTVAGFASGFHGMRRCHYERRQTFEQHVAKLCADAARTESQAK